MTEHSKHPDDLLPWYVNGTLDEVEREQVEAHLQTCARCQQEVTLLQNMRNTLQDELVTAPAEFSWQRLRRDLHQPHNTHRPGGWRWLPSMAAAAALVIVVQSVLLFNTSRDVPYGLAGDAPGATLVQVKFNPEAREKDIRNSLQAVRAEIVSGPSASGVYRLRLADSDPLSVLQSRIDTLGANTDVIDYIQRE